MQGEKGEEEKKETHRRSPITLPEFNNLPTRCKPNAIGQRHMVVFNLARHLKSQNPESTPADFRDYVESWFNEIKSQVSTKDFETTWSEFKNNWRRIKTLEGENGIAEMIKSINFDTIAPPDLHALGYRGKAWVTAQLCYMMSRNDDSGEFFLSCRTVNELFPEIPHTSAHSFLRSMVDDNILQIVKKGVRPQATSYKWIWSALDI